MTIKRIIGRLLAKTSIAGRIIQGLGAVLGIGGVTATQAGMFELTGDQIVDITIIICTTLIMLFGGQTQVPKEDQPNLPE